MAEVASAFVSLMFSAKGATDKITHEVAQAGAKAGDAGGSAAGKNFASNMATGTSALKGKLATEVVGAGVAAGKEGGTKAGHGFTSRLTLPGLRSKLRSEVVPASTHAGEEGGQHAGLGFTHSLKHHLREHLREVGTMIVGAFALEKGFDFFKESAEEARKFQKVSNQTNAVLKSTGEGAHVTAEHMNELSRSISEKVGIDHGAIQAGANLLLTFKNVRNEAGKGNDVFDQTTKVMTDMGAALHKGPTQSAKLLGKALNDPVKGMAALSRVGATFTDQQKLTAKALVQGGILNALSAQTGATVTAAQFAKVQKAQKLSFQGTVDFLTGPMNKAQTAYFKHLQEGGHTVEAQRTILKQLNSEFKGSAAATATAGEKAHVAFNDLKESVGDLLLPVFDKVATLLSGKVLPVIAHFVEGLKSGEGAGGKVREAFEKVSDVVKEFVGQMRDGTGPGGKVADALRKMGNAAKAAWPHIKDVFGWIVHNKATVGTFAGVILTVVAAVKIWAAVTKAMAFVQGLLDAALAANPLGLVVVAVAALAAGLVYAYTHSEKFRKFVQALWSALKVVGKFLGVVFVGYLKLLAKTWLTFGIVAVGALKLLVRAVFDAFGKIVDAAATGLGWLPGIGGKVKAAQKAFHAFADGTVNKLGDVENALKKVRDGIHLVKGKSVTITVHTKFTKPDRKSMANLYAAQGTAKRGELAGVRAAGGPVGRGKLYLVGEKGPELFRAPENGSIVPHSALRQRDVAPAALPARAGHSGPLFHIDRVEAQDVNHLLREMQHRGRALAGGGVAF